jgi:hypothetical protein
MKQTPYGMEVDPALPMTYDSSNLALKHIGEGLGYEDPPDHYNFRRWAANEVNRKCAFALLLAIHHSGVNVDPASFRHRGLLDG